MPNLDWNKNVWGNLFDWRARGEEWSKNWGGSEPQWFGSIYPRLHRFLPAKRILEIAPGFGRWTRFLVPACDEFVGIDLNEKCIEACRTFFADAKHARFFTNDGQSLAAADGQFDFVFSFDSLVHAEVDVLSSYIPQVLRKLAPGGVAFFHHSNLLACADKSGAQDGRALTVSADVVADLIKRDGGVPVIQEVINWNGDHLTDCLSLFARRDSYPSARSIRLENSIFMGEAKLIQHFQSPYSALSRAPATI